MARLTVDVYADGAAFDSYTDGDMSGELARILRDLAARVEAGATGGVVRDVNGNRVGGFDILNDDVNAAYEDDLQDLIDAHNLKPEETRSFLEAAFRDGRLRTLGTDIIQILPPMSRFNRDYSYIEKKHRVIDDLCEFFERFREAGLGGEQARG